MVAAVAVVKSQRTKVLLLKIGVRNTNSEMVFITRCFLWRFLHTDSRTAICKGHP